MRNHWGEYVVSKRTHILALIAIAPKAHWEFHEQRWKLSTRIPAGLMFISKWGKCPSFLLGEHWIIVLIPHILYDILWRYRARNLGFLIPLAASGRKIQVFVPTMDEMDKSCKFGPISPRLFQSWIRWVVEGEVSWGGDWGACPESVWKLLCHWKGESYGKFQDRVKQLF